MAEIIGMDVYKALRVGFNLCNISFVMMVISYIFTRILNIDDI